MPTFYFHLKNGTGWTRDPDGQELDSAGGALAAAMEEARSLIAADIVEGLPIDLSDFISIEDEQGQEIGRITFDQAVTFA